MIRVLSVLLSFTALFNGAFGALSPGLSGGASGGISGEVSGEVSGEIFGGISGEISGGASGGISGEISGSSEAADIPSIEEVLGDYTPSREGISWEDIEYVHYDPTDFYAAAAQLQAAEASGDPQEAADLYDQLYDDLLLVETLYELTYVKYCEDVTDDYWAGEYSYCYDLYSEMENALYMASGSVMDGSSGEASADFAGQTGSGEASGYGSAEADARLSELWAQEEDLITQYYGIMARADEVTYTYNGQEWTEAMLYSQEGDSLYYRDYNGYLAVYYGLEEALADQVGPIYLELAANRAEQAELMGYDNYADYEYELYGREYTTEDAQALCDAVKEIAPAYYDYAIYYSDLWYNTNVRPSMDTEDMVAVLGSYVSEIDESLFDAWAYLVTYDLYEIGDGANRMSGGYTTYLPYYDTPYIFLTSYDYAYYDFSSLVHEFGHFVNSYENVAEDPFEWGNYDLMEIHSTGLDMLFTEFYDDIYTTGADTARFNVLGNALYQVVSGCIYDEFERQVYADPDMTVEELNQLYGKICAEYGMELYGDADYYWVYSEIIDYPLYAISYVVSYLASIQIWDMAQTDFDAAVDTYLDILHEGAYDKDYSEVLTDCGLLLFTEDGAVEEICQPLIDELNSITGPYMSWW